MDPSLITEDYYAILGVLFQATPREIKTRYHDLAKRFHPDKNRGKLNATATFQKLQAAYETLGDPNRRSLYDREYLTKMSPQGFHHHPNAGARPTAPCRGNHTQRQSNSQRTGGSGESCISRLHEEKEQLNRKLFELTRRAKSLEREVERLMNQNAKDVLGSNQRATAHSIISNELRSCQITILRFKSQLEVIMRKIPYETYQGEEQSRQEQQSCEDAENRDECRKAKQTAEQNQRAQEATYAEHLRKQASQRAQREAQERAQREAETKAQHEAEEKARREKQKGRAYGSAQQPDSSPRWYTGPPSGVRIPTQMEYPLEDKYCQEADYYPNSEYPVDNEYPPNTKFPFDTAYPIEAERRFCAVYPIDTGYPFDAGCPFEAGYPPKAENPDNMECSFNTEYPIDAEYSVDAQYPFEAEYPVDSDYPIDAQYSVNTEYYVDAEYSPGAGYSQDADYSPDAECYSDVEYYLDDEYPSEPDYYSDAEY